MHTIEKSTAGWIQVSPVPVFRFRGNRRILYAGGLAVYLAVATIVLVSLLYLRQQDELRVVTNTQSLARSLELMYVGQIDTIDLALVAAANAIEHKFRDSDQKSIDPYLELLRSDLPNVDALRATNEQGDVIYGNGVLNPPINIADRDHFIRLRDEPKTGLIQANPMMGKADKQWVWLFARRISKPDGSFGGVVFARMNIAEIEKMMVTVNLDSSGIIALRDKDLGLIARHLFNGKNTIATGDRNASAPFHEAFKVNPLAGTYNADAAQTIDGISRTYSYRRNPKYQFLISVGLDRDVALEGWRKQAWVAAGVLLAFAVAVLTVVRVVSKSWRREKEYLDKRRETDEQIRQLAFFDPLTQLPNRRLLDDRLGQALVADKRSGAYGAVLFLDLDNFKPLNDAHGHIAGDQLLVEAANRMKRCVREIDTVSRLGGDEFVVLLSELTVDKAASAEKAGLIANKIRESLARPYLLTIKREGNADTTVEHHCTVSIGVVVFFNHAANASDILKSADAAMYQAKKEGRNLVRFYDASAKP